VRSEDDVTDWTDRSAAQAGLANPDLPPADLAAIAQKHKALRVRVAAHPAAYPDLLDWLDRRGDPAISAAVARRRQQLAAQPRLRTTRPAPATRRLKPPAAAPAEPPQAPAEAAAEVPAEVPAEPAPPPVRRSRTPRPAAPTAKPPAPAEPRAAVAKPARPQPKPARPQAKPAPAAEPPAPTAETAPVDEAAPVEPAAPADGQSRLPRPVKPKRAQPAEPEAEAGPAPEPAPPAEPTDWEPEAEASPTAGIDALLAELAEAAPPPVEPESEPEAEEPELPDVEAPAEPEEAEAATAPETTAAPASTKAGRPREPRPKPGAKLVPSAEPVELPPKPPRSKAPLYVLAGLVLIAALAFVVYWFVLRDTRPVLDEAEFDNFGQTVMPTHASDTAYAISEYDYTQNYEDLVAKACPDASGIKGQIQGLYQMYDFDEPDQVLIARFPSPRSAEAWAPRVLACAVAESDVTSQSATLVDGVWVYSATYVTWTNDEARVFGASFANIGVFVAIPTTSAYSLEQWTAYATERFKPAVEAATAG
jgi:hypothetical protein